ncbi:Peptidoglycan/LPS O-acetylase OafA/YrhL, contains acyltransferase and SGNH-hydrolase domains [Curtobacterium sp. 314Chir4.1]|uniref:acyltransferase family protein n=1 Tax=Curtobacterium sp. 314Chir4.1 TaxID=1279028 RepID=UPI000BCB4C6D|nr:acyltransferase [Curtobacterium sp. 314Chir4.1]SOC87424.1 Peptidoglycan/LPS O-acetylase OafA/YrhL, contains acyltransferase and SGNH-hydrolase domains [Curtobacterium sp. 314Chir4.1]
MRDRPAGRIGSLDGLRGVAAAVVLVHHALLVVPTLSAGNNGEPIPANRAWLVDSPLHVFWAGGEAVFVFFVLSGFVLTLPALRRRQDWVAYYPSRLLRLYVPVIASVALALVWFLLVPRVPSPGASGWLLRHVEPLTAGGLVGDLTLLSPTRLNSPLWSLTWEVAFSLLLPLFVLIAKATHRVWWVTALAALLLSGLGRQFHEDWLMYLPMFLLGSALAAGWERIPEIRRGTGWVLAVLAVLGITFEWWVPRSMVGIHVPIVVVASAGLIVLLCGKWLPAERLMLGRVPRTLGRLSFSLYLVHEPITVSVGLLLPTSLPWLTPFIAIPVAIVVAGLFARLVELPAHRLAKRVAKSITVRRARVGSASTHPAAAASPLADDDRTAA